MNDDHRQAGADIEITEEMIKAGASIVEDMFSASPSMAHRCAEEVFLRDFVFRIPMFWDRRNIPRLAHCHGRKSSSKTATKRTRNEPSRIEIADEPGMEERFQQGLQRALNTPPQHRQSVRPKPKERPASKGRVHKGKMRS
jgi:hypothetical protein